MVRRMGLIGEANIPDDVEVLEEQIQVREKLKSQMVGWLYPSVLTDEIARLRERRFRLLEQARFRSS